MARPHPLPIDPLAEAKRQWLAHGWTDAADGMSPLHVRVVVGFNSCEKVARHTEGVGELVQGAVDPALLGCAMGLDLFQR